MIENPVHKYNEDRNSKANGLVSTSLGVETHRGTYNPKDEAGEWKCDFAIEIDLFASGILP